MFGIRLSHATKRTLDRILVIAVVAGVVIVIVGGNSWYQRTVVFNQNRARYEQLAIAAARKHGIDPCLAMGVIMRESGFHAEATGAAGEVGLMQIMPGAADDWARVNHRSYGSRGALYQPELNIEIGVWYLGRASRDWAAREDRDVMALAQYNAGPTRAREWAALDQKNVHEKIPIVSTRTYITKVLEYRNQFRERGLCNPK